MSSALFNLSLKPILSISTLCFLGACGGSGLSGIVKNVDVVTRVDQASGDVLVDITSIVDIGRMSFPTLLIPIVNPKRPLEQYGSIGLGRDVSGQNAILVSVNVTDASRSDVRLDRTLPNGTPVPVFGARDMIVIPIDRSGRLYLDASTDRTLVGAAIAIKEFQNIGQYAPGLNLFFDIPQKNGIKGIAGVFTGREADQNGIALFFDVTEALRKNGLSTQALKLSSQDAAEVDWQFAYEKVNMRSSKTRKVTSALYDMTRKRKVMQIK